MFYFLIEGSMLLLLYKVVTIFNYGYSFSIYIIQGATIPKYKLEKIFDKFYRGDESRQTNNGGTGLGLAITKEIIELHNGTICAKSDNDVIEFQIKLKKVTC